MLSSIALGMLSFFYFYPSGKVLSTTELLQSIAAFITPLRINEQAPPHGPACRFTGRGRSTS
jgi:hypothetical protein